MKTLFHWEKLEIFKDMENREIGEIMAFPGWLQRTYEAGASIHDAGESLDSLIILMEGCVEGCIITETGRRLNLTRKNAPALIGPAMIFSDKQGILQVKVIKRAVLLKLSRERLRTLFLGYPGLMDNFLRVCANRFLYLSSRLELLSFHSIRKKIAHYILNEYELRGSPFIRLLTLTSLAEYMGVERPSLSAVYHTMRKEGFFRAEGKLIYIDDPINLRKELEKD